MYDRPSFNIWAPELQYQVLFCNMTRILFTITSLSCIAVLKKINIIISIIVIIIDSLKSSLVLNISTKHYILEIQNIIKHSNPDQHYLK